MGISEIRTSWPRPSRHMFALDMGSMECPWSGVCVLVSPCFGRRIVIRCTLVSNIGFSTADRLRFNYVGI